MQGHTTRMQVYEYVRIFNDRIAVRALLTIRLKLDTAYDFWLKKLGDMVVVVIRY